jgi:hypothetical protein
VLKIAQAVSPDWPSLPGARGMMNGEQPWIGSSDARTFCSIVVFWSA